MKRHNKHGPVFFYRLPAFLIFLFWVGISLGLNSCSSFSGDKAVDKDFLDSDSYRRFQNSYQNEQRVHQQKGDARQQVIDILSSKIKTGDIRKFELPVTLQIPLPDEWKQGLKAIPLLAKPSDHKLSAQPLGFYRKDDLDLAFVLLQTSSLYPDESLAVVSFKGDSVRGFQQIGRYHETLEKKMSSRVKIWYGDRLQIRSVNRREIIYPVDQVHVDTLLFRVDSTGTIRRGVGTGDKYHS